MKTTVIVNDLSELKTVAQHFGIEINAATTSVSFPYHFEIDHEILVGDNEVLTFEQFKEKNLSK